MFVAKQAEIYNGTDHVYNADVFNEMQPPESSTEFISNTSKAIYSAMTAGDKDAVWLMQGWMFLNDYWKDDLIQAWLKGMGKVDWKSSKSSTLRKKDFDDFSHIGKDKRSEISHDNLPPLLI